MLKTLKIMLFGLVLLFSLPATAYDPLEDAHAKLREQVRESAAAEKEKEEIQIALVFGLIGGIISSRLARRRGRSTLRWFWITFLLGGLPVIALYLMPSLPTPDTHVLCPDCRELVPNDARVCKSCGCKLIPLA